MHNGKTHQKKKKTEVKMHIMHKDKLNNAYRAVSWRWSEFYEEL